MLMLLKSPLGTCFFRLNIPISFFDATFASAPQPFPLSACQSWAFLPRTPAPEFLLHVSPGWSPVSCAFRSTKTAGGGGGSSLLCGHWFIHWLIHKWFKHLYFYKWVPGENWLLVYLSHFWLPVNSQGTGPGVRSLSSEDPDDRYRVGQ